MSDAFSKIATFIILIFALVFAAFYFLSIQNDLRLGSKTEYGMHKKTIWIDGVPLSVFLAVTDEQKSAGLSVFDKLKAQEGMLFVFSRPGKYGIWMKGMKFPIDVFWIDKNGFVVDIWKSASPDSYPYVYYPRQEAKYILETNADFAEIYNIGIGSRVYKLPK